MEPITPAVQDPTQPATFIYSSSDSVNTMIDLQGNQPKKIWDASQDVIKAENELDSLKQTYDYHYKDMYLVATGKTVGDKDAAICSDAKTKEHAEKVQKAKQNLAIAKSIYKLRCDEFEAMKSQTMLVNQLLRNQL